MNRTALIVDDSLVARLSMKKIAVELGFSTCEASSGEAALEALESLAQATLPGIVFLDLTMPGMGGVEALKEIRVRWAGLPVVVVTADIQTRTLDEVRAAGASAIVRKPASRDEVVAALGQVEGGAVAS